MRSNRTPKDEEYRAKLSRGTTVIPFLFKPRSFPRRPDRCGKGKKLAERERKGRYRGESGRSKDGYRAEVSSVGQRDGASFPSLKPPINEEILQKHPLTLSFLTFCPF